jgi:hypothetical protein
MNKWYVYFDEDDYITSVTNELKEFGNYYECPEELIIDFLKGTKNFTSHKIKIKNYKDIIIEEERKESYKPIYKDIFVVETKSIDDTLFLKIVHDNSSNKWIFQFNEEMKKTYLDSNVNAYMQFFLCHAEDYNVLYRRFDIVINSLAHKDIEVPFVLDVEQSFADLCIITRKYIDQIGVTHV